MKLYPAEDVYMTHRQARLAASEYAAYARVPSAYGTAYAYAEVWHTAQHTGVRICRRSRERTTVIALLLDDAGRKAMRQALNGPWARVAQVPGMPPASKYAEVWRTRHTAVRITRPDDAGRSTGTILLDDAGRKALRKALKRDKNGG